jgi:hypothetical protein
MQMGTSSTCENITVRNSLIHYLGDIGIYLASTKNTTIDNCVFSDQMSDHLRSDGRNENFTVKNCILYRTWARKGSNGGISHSDHCQNTTGNQPGWYKHSFINTIFSPGDNQYPHIQCAFYECDNYPTYPRGSGLYLTNCLIEGRAPNAVYSRPGDDLKVVNCTIVQNQFSGMDGLNEVGLSLRDTTFNEPKITVSSTTSNGFSAGNNIIDSSVYYSHDLNTGLGDQIIGSTQFKNDKYNSDLFDYPLYSSSLFRPTILLNDSYVLSATALKRFSPKTTSSIHPNQMGRHHGASALLQTLGALA